MLQRTVFINKIRMLQRTMLQWTVFINKIRTLQQTQMLQRTTLQWSFINKIRMLQRREMLQRKMLQWTVFINKIRMLQRTQMLQRTNATTNSFYQENQDATTNHATMKFLSIKSGCYNEDRCYKERMLQQIVFINKIRMLQRTTLQWSFYQ